MKCCVLAIPRPNPGALTATTRRRTRRVEGRCRDQRPELLCRGVVLEGSPGTPHVEVDEDVTLVGHLVQKSRKSIDRGAQVGVECEGGEELDAGVIEVVFGTSEIGPLGVDETEVLEAARPVVAAAEGLQHDAAAGEAGLREPLREEVLHGSGAVDQCRQVSLSLAS